MLYQQQRDLDNFDPAQEIRAIDATLKGYSEEEKRILQNADKEKKTAEWEKKNGKVWQDPMHLASSALKLDASRKELID